MKCVKCGKEIPDNVKFCPNCGAEQAGAKPTAVPTSTQGNGPTAEAPKKRKNFLTAIIAAAAVVVVVAIVAAISGSREPTLNLNEYASVEYTGYNGYGKAQVSFDVDRLVEDYYDDLTYEDYTPYEVGQALYNSCIDVALDRQEGLSNGETVTWAWECDDETALDDVGVKLKYSDLEFTVEGLEDPESVDLADCINVTFSGITQNGTAKIEYLMDGNYSIRADKTTGLSNGDTVTVTLEYPGKEDMDENVARTGIVFSSTEVTYLVTGLEYYVSELSQITDTALSQMQAKAEEEFSAYVARSWGEESTLDSFSYAGSYLLTPQDPDSHLGNPNLLALIFHGSATIDYTTSSGDQNFKADQDFYWYATFKNLTVGADGEIFVDVDDCTTSLNDSFQILSDNIQSSWGMPMVWTFRGYETVEDLDSAIDKFAGLIYNVERGPLQ